MTKYFQCKIMIFDEEEYHTKESLLRLIQKQMCIFTEDTIGLLWENAEVTEIKESEYEKED